MARYLLRFQIILEREIEVPDGLDWCQANRFVIDQWGVEELAATAACKTTEVVLTDFIKIPRSS